MPPKGGTPAQASVSVPAAASNASPQPAAPPQEEKRLPHAFFYRGFDPHSTKRILDGRIAPVAKRWIGIRDETVSAHSAATFLCAYFNMCTALGYYAEFHAVAKVSDNPKGPYTCSDAEIAERALDRIIPRP